MHLRFANYEMEMTSANFCEKAPMFVHRFIHFIPFIHPSLPLHSHASLAAVLSKRSFKYQGRNQRKRKRRQIIPVLLNLPGSNNTSPSNSSFGNSLINEKFSVNLLPIHFCQRRNPLCQTLRGEGVMPWSFAMGLPGVISPPEADEGTGKALPIPLSTSLQKAAVQNSERCDFWRAAA